MRTTIRIEDALLEEAKARARQRRTTLGKVIEEALRAALSRPPNTAAPPFELVTFTGDGPHPGIDLDRSSALLAAEDIERYRRGA